MHAHRCSKQHVRADSDYRKYFILVVMNAHGFLVDVGLQSIHRIRQGRQAVQLCRRIPLALVLDDSTCHNSDARAKMELGLIFQ